MTESPDRHWSRKLDPRLRDLLARTTSPEVRVDAVLRFVGDAARLGELGVSVRAVAGSIATGTFFLRDLERIAEAREIEYIECSRELGRDESSA